MLKLHSGHVIPDVEALVLPYGEIRLIRNEWLPFKDNKIVHPKSTKELPSFGTIPYAATVLRQWRNQ